MKLEHAKVGSTIVECSEVDGEQLPHMKGPFYKVIHMDGLVQSAVVEELETSETHIWPYSKEVGVQGKAISGTQFMEMLKQKAAER